MPETDDLIMIEDATWGPYRVTQSAAAKKPIRSCGDCTLCCRVLPVSEIKKPRGIWCAHADHGCKIYETRPPSCRTWSCLWVTEKGMGDELKPNRCHVVADMMITDIIVEVGGHAEKRHALQLWCDQNYPGAWRGLAVQAFIFEVVAKQGVPALVRFRNRGIVVFAPPLTPDRKWHEIESKMMPDSDQEWEAALLERRKTP